MPSKGFQKTEGIYVSPLKDPDSVEVIINKNSERLQKLEPFPQWDGNDFVKLPILVKAKGKCTTDHISPAGPWLFFRGHLDKLSDNMFLGAVNAYSNEVGKGKNMLVGNVQPFPDIARQYKDRKIKWIVIGDRNYGEGSSREHAAMSPRFMGCAAVIVKSFARIHETNLKKQGILALTFSNYDDFEKIKETDRISLVELNHLEQGKPIKCIINHENGTNEEIVLNHSYNKFQIQWFHAGSALNVLKENQ